MNEADKASLASLGFSIIEGNPKSTAPKQTPKGEWKPKVRKVKKEDFSKVPERERGSKSPSALATESMKHTPTRQEQLTNQILRVMRYKLKKISQLQGSPINPEFAREVMQETFLTLLSDNIPEDDIKLKSLVRRQTGRVYRRFQKIDRVQRGTGSQYVKGGNSLLDRGQVIPMLLTPAEFDSGRIERSNEDGRDVTYIITPSEFKFEEILSATDFKSTPFMRIPTGQYIDAEKLQNLVESSNRITRKRGHFDMERLRMEYGFSSIAEARKFITIPEDCIISEVGQGAV